MKYPLVSYLLMFIGLGIYLTIGWRFNLLRGHKPKSEHISLNDILSIGLIIYIVLGIVLMGSFVVLLFGFHEALRINNISSIPLFLIAGTGLTIAALVTWRVLIYDPPLEKVKPKRKRKHKEKIPDQPVETS